MLDSAQQCSASGADPAVLAAPAIHPRSGPADHAGTPPTNATATPAMRRITIRNLKVKAHTQFLDCAGLSDSGIEDITFDDVVVTGTASQSCQYCSISADPGSTPRPKCEKAVP